MGIFFCFIVGGGFRFFFFEGLVVTKGGGELGVLVDGGLVGGNSISMFFRVRGLFWF